MSETDLVIERIRQVLATETSAVLFSNMLFSPTGLFNQIAKTEDERRQLAHSPLFRDAQLRLRELQLQEAKRFSSAFKDLPGTDMAGESRQPSR